MLQNKDSVEEVVLWLYCVGKADFSTNKYFGHVVLLLCVVRQTDVSAIDVSKDLADCLMAFLKSGIIFTLRIVILRKQLSHWTLRLSR